MNEKTWIEANGIALRYAYRRGTDATYVLLHEMGGSIESWEEAAARLPPDAGVLLYDQRGFGLSEKVRSPMTMEQHVADLLALLDALGITQPVVLSGVAVGAGIAMAFAARHPERVGGLLALAPACGVAPERRAAAMEMAQRIAGNGLRSEGARLFETAYPEALRTDPARYESYRSAWLSADPHSLAAIYRMLATQDLDADVAALPKATLLVGGTYDALRPEAEIRRLAGLCAHAACIFAPTGHFMQVNSPRFVAHALAAVARDAGRSVRAIQEFLDAPGNRHGRNGPLR
ncbi:alpha/beta fold hydrolase [Parapusillimonas granuli]|uniref:Alpha/beta hydrolase n=1 Tax=Parapusillimonas granuli TaxID=380911 RepID=A0A853FTB2_9BURK|nr:alpha/beta hydrolase [Parapusillimonas granuli]MBB5216164.1 3-oxoadipate enol-lactonase [Parapusillimonas granuli]MEB2400439.1 alpha/beta hydrolase [Alcaligenaceae bacterium]NYT47843.1 alpha/beta hydrolase [Parapusillimonas granuli]